MMVSMLLALVWYIKRHTTLPGNCI